MPKKGDSWNGKRAGKNNPMFGRKRDKSKFWKGEQVSYKGLHQWVLRWKKKPENCEDCHQKKPLDAANKSGKYLRDLDDWTYLCRVCHRKHDGRTTKLSQFSLSGDLVKNWGSIREAARGLKMSATSIKYALGKKTGQYRGFIWKKR